MPIFISYSHEDKEFVDKFAMQLVCQNISVWVDRWELSIGDSIIDKVQEAADGASALLVILSKASISSEWCKKELSSGFLRELEEKRVIVMPVLLEDCDIPLFARGKLYADFRTNFDDGLRTVIEGIAKVTNPCLARIDEPDFHIDWSITTVNSNRGIAVILNYVQLPKEQPYTVLTNIEVLASPCASENYHKISEEKGEDFAQLNVMTTIYRYYKSIPDEKPILANQQELVKQFVITEDDPDEFYELRIGVRRLGEDTGRDILSHTTNLITETYSHMSQVLSNPCET